MFDGETGAPAVLDRGGLEGVPAPHDGRSDEEVEAELLELCAHLDVGMSRYLELLSEALRREVWAVPGCSSPGMWLSWRAGISPVTAREHVRVALALDHLALVRERFRRGELSYAKVRAITRVATPANEAVLVEWGLVVPASQMVSICRAYRPVLEQALAGQDPPEPKAEPQPSLSYASRDDGSVVLTVVLPGNDAEAVLVALDAAAESLWSPPPDASAEADGQAGSDASAEARGGGTDFGDPVAEDGCVPECERRGESLVALCRAYVGGGTELSVPAGDTTLYLHVDAEVVAEAMAPPGPAHRPGGRAGTASPDPPPPGKEMGELRPPLLVTPRGFSVPRGALAALACDCRLQAVLHGDGKPLALGRSVRRASAAQRRALEGRDLTCSVPGCTRRAYLDAHHIRWWTEGGPTDLDNLTLLCRRHHRCVHGGSLRVQRQADGSVRFFTSHGVELTCDPPRPCGPDLVRRSAALGVDVDPGTTTPAWDGSGVELWRCVDALLATDGLQ